MTATFEQNWKILPDPIKKGLHEYHDHRWVVTADAQAEMSLYIDNEWFVRNGHIICQMRDIHPKYAKAIAAVPEMINALAAISLLDYDNSSSTEEKLKDAISEAREALEKTR